MPVTVLRAEISAALLVALASTGCSTGTGVGNTGGPLPSATTAATPQASSSASPRPQTTQTSPGSPTISALTTSAVLTQYRAFFAALTPASKATPAVRYAMLRKVATEPELTRLLGGIAAAQHVGEVFYGRDLVRPQIVRVTGMNATLRDCADTSQHGRLKVATGKRVTVGYKNDLAIVKMIRGSDGVWRVATVESKPAGSCSAA